MSRQGRTRQDIMAELARRAASYVPEWKYDPAEMDAGGALAELFGDMFYGTVDRYGALPSKYYTEFLNLLGARRREAGPAMGCLRFTCTEGAESAVRVPEGTEAFSAAAEGDEGNVVCETVFPIEAVSARLLDACYCDPGRDVVSHWSLDGDIALFSPSAEGSVQEHWCAFYGENVLAVSQPCDIELQIGCPSKFLEDDTTAMLADPRRTVWEYFDGGKYVPFDKVSADRNVIRLKKHSAGQIASDGYGRSVRVRAVSPPDVQLILSGAAIRSAPAQPVRAQSAAYVDIPIELGEGGYCFGRRPSEYDVMFIRSDDVLSKNGAEVCLSLDITTVTWSDVDVSARYEYGKSIIDKRSAQVIEPEDIFVDQVVWEYWNGTGWARLEVRQCRNPFDCSEEGRRDVVFTCPADSAPTSVNAEEGWYIRARVANVHNYFSTRGRWLLPFVKDILCSYAYGGYMPVSAVRAANNGAETYIRDAGAVQDLRLAAIKPLEPAPRAMYLRFDSSPKAMPLSLYFNIISGDGLGSRLRCEYLTEGGFAAAQLIDRTEDLKGAGALLIYMPEQTVEAELFGKRGHWLRLLCDSPRERAMPVAAGVYTNVTEAVQRRRAEDQLFNTGVYDADKLLQLLEAPVLDCDVWVEEAGSIDAAAMEAIAAERPNDIRIHRDGGELISCRIRWHRTECLRAAGPKARVYELDSQNGIIAFGDGRHGCVPPEGDLNIRVSYSTCRGAAGNLPEGSVDTLVTPITGITAVTNITPMCGGSDQQTMEELQALGSGLLRRRGRAVSARDFEELVRTGFGALTHVRCFPGMDGSGRLSPGSVCVVITPNDGGDRRFIRRLCTEIREFLTERCDCLLAAGGGLFVVPSTVVTVNVTAAIRPEDWDAASEIQRSAAAAVDRLVTDVWECAGIGRGVRIHEIYRAIKSATGVAAVEELLIEGEYTVDGKKRIAPLGERLDLPFVSLRNGAHTIKLTVGSR